MNEAYYKPGEILKITIPENWKPPKTVAKYCKLIQSHKISYVLVIENMGNGTYIVLPCSTAPKGNAVSVEIEGRCYYAYIKRWQLDVAVLRRFIDHHSFDPKSILAEIESKFQEQAARRSQAKERQKERKKSEPTIQEVLYNWPTKAIAEERRKKEHIIKPPKPVKKTPKQPPNDVIQLPKTIKGFECVPLTGLNRNAFKHKIILSNYTCNKCPECGNQLIKFVNFLQISEIEGIRTPGQYCTKCDLFYEDHGPKLRSLVDDGIIFDSYTLNVDYLIPDYSQKIRLSHSIKSASLAIHLNCKDSKENRLVTIVSERSDRNHQLDIFHYSDWFARQLLYSVYKEHKTINIAGDIFSILKIIRLDWKNGSFLNQIKIDTIVLRAGGGLYGGIHQRNTELVDILLYSPYTDCFEVAHATYDTENEVYFMDAKVFRGFVEKYGNPGVKIAAYESGLRDFSTMREESILRAYGYVVGITRGLPEAARREILSEVMDLEIMSAEAILRLLNHNISMHSQEKDRYARMDWEADKAFVLEYKVNPDRFVVATIGL